MEEWRRDGRKEVVMVDLEALVPKEHLNFIVLILLKKHFQ